MAFTSPRTWTPGETVTASIMNTHVRDNFTALAARGIVLGFGSAGAGALTTGVKAYLEVPVSATIVGWTLVADQSGSIVIDVWKDTYANFPPLVADTIAGSEKPTLSTAQKNQDLDLTTWTTAVTIGDILAFNIDSITTINQATLTLRFDS